jgi:hypothetical protein
MVHPLLQWNRVYVAAGDVNGRSCSTTYAIKSGYEATDRIGIQSIPGKHTEATTSLLSAVSALSSHSLQVNRIGVKMERSLVVDLSRGLLLLLTKQDSRLLRQFPLTQLIQLERSESELDQVNLVFTSQGVPTEEEETLGSLEVVLRVKFQNDLRLKDFVSQIMASQKQLSTAYEGECIRIYIPVRGKGNNKFKGIHTCFRNILPGCVCWLYTIVHIVQLL